MWKRHLRQQVKNKITFFFTFLHPKELSSHHYPPAPYIEGAKVGVANAANNAMENPSFRSAVETVNTSVVNLKDETKKDIERRQQEQGEAGGQEEQQAVSPRPEGGVGGEEKGWEGDQVVIRDDEVL